MEQKIQVGFVQINEKKEGMARKGKGRTSENVPIQEVAIFPYSIGMLQAYAQKYAQNPDEFEFLIPIYNRRKVADAVAHLKNADIVGFSTYIWNIRLSLAIAKALKEVNPDVFIVFGGPQVPDKSEAFLREHLFIDMVCHGEGEQVFLMILENWKHRTWVDVPSISYLDSHQQFHTNPKIARKKQIEDYPSPYLSGTFDPLMAAHPETNWVMIWETNRGCPFSCSFCDWGSAVNAKIYQFDIDRLFHEVQWYAMMKGEIMMCADANFGIFQRDLDLAKFTAYMKSFYGYPRVLTVQNTKNATERAYEVQKVLVKSRLNPIVTLSLQTHSEQSLKSIKRGNISSKHFTELQRRYTRDKIPTYTDVILALPDETYDSYLDGISFIIEGGQHGRILFYNLTILPNAEMGEKAYQEKFGLEFVPQVIVNMHDTYPMQEEHPEYIDTVIATHTMPKEDWVKAKCFWWMTEFLYYDCVLKIPIVLLNHLTDLSIRNLIEPFLYPNQEKYPVLAEVMAFFTTHAQNIQKGENEFVAGPDYFSVYWNCEQFVWIELAKNNKIECFYQEALLLLSELIVAENLSVHTVLNDALYLNHQLIRLPYQFENKEIELSHNVWQFYRAVMEGEEPVLQSDNYRHLIRVSDNSYPTFEDWLDNLIICQNDKERNLHIQQIFTPNLSLSESI